MAAPSVVAALRESAKGRLNYGTSDEPNLKDILTSISKHLSSLSIPPNEVFGHSRIEDFNSSSGGKFGIEMEDPGFPPVVGDAAQQRSKPVVKILEKQEVEDIFLVQNFDHSRQEQVQELALARQFEWRQCDLMLRKQADEALKSSRDQRCMVAQNQGDQLCMQQQILVHHLKQQQLHQKQQSKDHIKSLNEKLRDAELTRKQQDLEVQKRLQDQEKQHAREAERKLKELQENEDKLRHLVDYQREINQKYFQIAESLKQCVHKSHLPKEMRQVVEKHHEVMAIMVGLIENAKTQYITNDKLAVAKELVDRVDGYLQMVLTGVDSANVFGEKSNRLHITAEPPSSSSTIAQHDVGSGALTHDKVTPPARLNSDLLLWISPSSLRSYARLKDILSNLELSCQPLLIDANLKKFRFDLQKAVNIPVNAISTLSPAHVHDKLVKLRRLLQGQPVEVNEKRVNPTLHPQGVDFCKHLLAKKFVLQGEMFNPEAAFAVAAVIVELWSEFPTFGEIILARFYERCPVTVPFYIPQEEGQSQEDHYRALGYLYVDGVVEKQDKFLKRMSGIVRLYAAILSAPVRRSHPHGIEYGWAWLSRVINLEPQADITATAIFEFLDVSGHKLQQVYGKQFHKLLGCLQREMLPKIRQVTNSGTGGPVSRLEQFIHKCLVLGTIPLPDGILPTNFTL